MRRVAVAIAMVAVGVAVGLLVFGFGTFGDSEGTRGSEDNSYMDSATYVGTDNCKGCHNTAGWGYKHDEWNSTLHSKMIQVPSSSTVKGDFTIDPVLNDTGSGIGDITVDLDDTGGAYTVTLNGTTYPVNYTLGGGGWKQRYLTQIGGSLYILPVQWNLATTEWVAYDLGDWYDAPGVPKAIAKEQSWNRRCAGCHTTGYEPGYDAGTSEWTGTWSEFNIGCEACHGPGSDHNGDSDYIWKSVDAQICGQCHIRGTSNGTLTGTTQTLGYPWSATQGSYMPGDTISEFYTPGEGLWGDGMTSKQHHQQYADWLTTSSNGHAEIAPIYAQNEGCMSCRSTEGFIAMVEGETPSVDAGNATWQQTCAACHAPHEDTGEEHMLRLAPDDLCESCHTVEETSVGSTPHHAQKEMLAGWANITGFTTGDPWMSGAVGCSDCHMVKTAKSAVEWDITAHTYKSIDPQKTIDFGMPNSCSYYCHTDTTAGHTIDDANASAHIAEWKVEVEHEFHAVEANITAAEALINDAPELDFANATIMDALDKLDEAHYTHYFVEAGKWPHNPDFAHDLLTFANGRALDILGMFETGSVKGKIVDKNNDPIVGAEIKIGEKVWDTTDANGEFEFEIAPGTRTFSIFDEGEEVDTFQSTVTAGQVSDAGEFKIGEAVAEDNLILYLLIVVFIIIVVIIIAVVVMKRRGGPAVEEEMEPEPEPMEEPELEE